MRIRYYLSAIFTPILILSLALMAETLLTTSDATFRTLHYHLYQYIYTYDTELITGTVLNSSESPEASSFIDTTRQHRLNRTH